MKREELRKDIDLHIRREVEKLKLLPRRPKPEKYRQLIKLGLEANCTEGIFRTSLETAGLHKTHISKLCSIRSNRMVAMMFVGPPLLGEPYKQISFREALAESRNGNLTIGNKKAAKAKVTDDPHAPLQRKLNKRCRKVTEVMKYQTKSEIFDCRLFEIQYSPLQPGQKTDIVFDTTQADPATTPLDLELESELVEELSWIGRHCGLSNDLTLSELLNRINFEKLQHLEQPQTSPNP